MPPPSDRPEPPYGVEARGGTLVIGERLDAGGVGEVAPLHVHHADDEAWYVIAGRMRFRFIDHETIAEAGSTVFVPAGVAHTFGPADADPVHYLIVTTARINELISRLHQARRSEHPAIFREYESELLE